MLLSDCDGIFSVTYYSIYCHDRWRCLRALYCVFNQGPDVIASETITNYIPLGYKKEEPEKYFNLVDDHIQWMDKCRNIAITGVPSYEH